MNRVDFPNASEQHIIRNLPERTNAANVVASPCQIFTINRSQYLSQTAPRYHFVDISADIVDANKPNPGLVSGLERKFREYADKWYAETRRDSSITRILSNENYLRVIELGTPVIPLILKELQSRPRPWFLVLRVLTKNENVGRGYPGNFEKMAEAWINWGRERGIIK